MKRMLWVLVLPVVAMVALVVPSLRRYLKMERM
jgi:hypothetical protein